MENNGNGGAKGKGLWGIIDRIEGDKVIWLIVLLLILFSVLTIFSSTSNIQDASRMEAMVGQFKLALAGFVIIFLMYKCITGIGLYRVLSQFGFLASFILLSILVLNIRIHGFIEAQTLNDATRSFKFLGKQIHVYEIVKVVMIMYMAWALDSYKVDCEAMKKGERSGRLWIANWLSGKEKFAFMKTALAKRCLYIYMPTLVVFGMVAAGSNSSAIIITGILWVTMLLGGISIKELMIPIVAAVILFGALWGIHEATDGQFMNRQFRTLVSRFTADTDTRKLDDMKEGTQEYKMAVDKMRQPYGAMIAIHQGGFIGKGSGNSRQRYAVPHIYSDYMFSFIVEEYGFVGAIVIIMLYLSLLARSAMIARLCSSNFAKIALGGLALLITGQAMLHILVNVGIGPMTGQTLPLISDGASAFLVFCVAFGVILSISRMAKKKMLEMETAENIREKLKDLEQIDDEQQ